MVKGVNYPIGLIEWAKKIGPDKILQILKDLLDHTGDGRYRPTPLLKDWVTKGKLEIK
jgi:3-hydroxybutyryl-CoA dehydrogenase